MSVGQERPPSALLARWRINPLALGFVGPGAILVLVAFVGPSWFQGAVQLPDGSRFSQIPTFLDDFHQQAVARHVDGYFSSSASHAYFTWLGWLLLLAGLGACLLAISGYGADHWSLRWLGMVVSATGVGVTFLALDLVIVQGNPPASVGLPDYGTYLSHTAVGAWAAIAGFTFMLVGCAVPRRDP